MPTKIVVNCSTGESTNVELTAEEISQMESNAAAYAIIKQQEEDAKAAREALKASAKAKLIAGQPLTAEEADVLVL